MMFYQARRYIIAILFVYCAYCITDCTIALSDIFIVKSKDITSYALALDGFKSIVTEKAIEYDMEGDFDKGRKIAKKIKKRCNSKKAPQAIFTIGMMASKLIQEQMTHVPVVFCMVINPVKNGLSNKKNIGGVSLDLSPVSQLTGLQKIISGIRNIGVIYDSGNSGNIIKEAKKIAVSLNMKLIAREISSAKEVPDTLKSLVKDIDVLWLITDSTVLNRKSFKFISTTVMENRVPVMACSPQLVKMGLPFSFYADEYMTGRQAGLMCQKVLNGEIGEVLPVEFPEDVYLAINLISMEKFGIKATKQVIDSAKEIYK